MLIMVLCSFIVSAACRLLKHNAQDGQSKRVKWGVVEKADSQWTCGDNQIWLARRGRSVLERSICEAP
jgi:hypothetical protein